MKQRQSGFSLMEIVVALGIGSVLVLFSGNLLVSSKMQEQKASITSEVDRIHLINLQRSRNSRFLAEKNLIFAGLNTGQKKNAELCMTGKIPAGGCAGYNQGENAATVFIDETPSQYFRSTISARRICDSRGCHKIEIEVKTSDSNPDDKYDIFERKSVGYLPAFSFTSSSDMDVTCGSDVMGAFNYYQMQPECGKLPGNFVCNNGDRIMNVGFGASALDSSLCAGMAQRDCTGANQFGISSSGVLRGQQACQGPAATIGSSCTPSWRPRIEDICAGIRFTQSDGCGNSRNVLGTGDCAVQSYPSTTASGPYTPPTRPPTPTTAGSGCWAIDYFHDSTVPRSEPYGCAKHGPCTPIGSVFRSTKCNGAGPKDFADVRCIADPGIPYGQFGACVLDNTASPTTTATGPTTTEAPYCVAVPLVRVACFAGGTKITMADGKTKSIEDVLIGESVQTFDEELGVMRSSMVVETLHHPARRQMMYTFKLSNGSQFKVTPEHLLYSVDHGYTPAVWLQHDFMKSIPVKMLDENAQIAEVVSVLATDEAIPTYNLHVQGIAERDHHGTRNGRGHNYFANGILAHNRKCCVFDPDEGCTSTGVAQPYPIAGTGVKCLSTNVGLAWENTDQCNPTELEQIQVCNTGADNSACQ